MFDSASHAASSSAEGPSRLRVMTSITASTPPATPHLTLLSALSAVMLRSAPHAASTSAEGPSRLRLTTSTIASTPPATPHLTWLS